MISHGTVRGFSVLKCSCDLCDAARLRSNQKAKAWRDANQEKSRQSSDSWKQRNPDKVRAGVVSWDARNPGRRRQLASEWSSNNRSARNFIHQRRRFRVREAETYQVTLKDWERLCSRYRGCCAYCGERRPLTQEHVIPLSRGGNHSIGNLLPVCKSCNSSKRDRLLVEWLAQT